ncbi:MAG: DUF3152 domain-containing protein [Candidatus Saccharibacteria bacterium]|nr:DUF3152 domain-containing protein [Candidatus Saccharibacteria bacterium]
MKVWRFGVWLVCLLVVATTAVVQAHVALSDEATHGRVVDAVMKTQQLPDALADVPTLSNNKPDWYRQQLSEAERQRYNTVTYSIATKGHTASDINEFAAQVHETLNDGRGWARMGVHFQRVASGGSFHLILSEAKLLPTFSSGCSVEWSCRVGVSVIINDDRWKGATSAWNGAGGSLRDYRHMVVNHEVGYWLGHGHQQCTTPGAPAAVMQQQSIDLQGCAFNPWPLESELWSTTLGVRR